MELSMLAQYYRCCAELSALVMLAYLIFVTGTTGSARGEKSVMWRNFKFLYMTDVEKSEISSHVD